MRRSPKPAGRWCCATWEVPTAPTSTAGASHGPGRPCSRRRPGAVCQPGVSRAAAIGRRTSQQTVAEGICDRALALVQFDRLMAEHAVTPFFQPIVDDGEPRNRGLRSLGPQPAVRPGNAQGNVRASPPTEPGSRAEHDAALGGVQASQGSDWSPHLFVNTHPRELAEPGLLAFAADAADEFPEQRLTAGNPRIGCHRCRPDERNPRRPGAR